MGGRGVRAYRWVAAGLCAAGAATGGLCLQAAADTLEWAVVQAYQNNPSLNSQRAALRVIDENVPQALSGYRPKVSVTAVGGYNYTNAVQQLPVGGALTTTNYTKQFISRTVGATGTQTLFNGFPDSQPHPAGGKSGGCRARDVARHRAAGAAGRGNRLHEFVARWAILELNQSNVQVLTEQLKQTRDRFNVGEVTRTDVAQSESRLAAGRSALLGAQSNYVTSQANYRRVIGVDPGRLAAGTPVDRLSPGTLPKAIVQGQALSPSVLAAMYGVDVAELAVKISEGALYPNLTLTAALVRVKTRLRSASRNASFRSSAQLTVPIYQGGGEYSAIRQSKETLGQQRLITRHQSRSGAGDGGAELGPARCRQGADRGDDGAGQRCGDRAQRRA
jgi:outer membrane protein